MNIVKIFSFLVYPAKGLDEQPAIGGTDVPLSGNLFRMLSEMFEKSDRECKIEISFEPSAQGEQRNDCRDEFIDFIRTEDISAAQVLARRLQSVTTNRSGLGLVFFILGRDGSNRKILIARFPADFGILAEESQTSLRVEFLEKVFMRNALAFKAALYTGQSFDADFWTGKAVDKQVNPQTVAISGYWIREFLLSDFSTTSAAGTRRLATALREAMQSTDNLGVKEEISAAARLARNLANQMISIEDFGDRFGLSAEAKDAVSRQLKHPSLRSDHFTFDVQEFNQCLPFMSLELSNGAVLTAPVSRFDECFIREEAVDSPGVYTFRTQGTIINEKLRKSK